MCTRIIAIFNIKQVLVEIYKAIEEFKATRMPKHWFKRKNWKTTEKIFAEALVGFFLFTFGI